MGKIDKERLQELLEKDMSFTEIARELGCSRQNVCRYASAMHPRRRKPGLVYEMMVYEGIRTTMLREKISVPEFAYMVTGSTAKNQIAKMRNFLLGTESRYSAKQLIRMCEICNMSLEATFRRREPNG